MDWIINTILRFIIYNMKNRKVLRYKKVMKKRNARRLVRTIIILLCILFVCVSVTSTVISVNTHHLKCCQMESCPLCMLIENTTNFIKNLSYIIEYIILLNVAIPLSYIRSQRKLEQQETLTELNVRLNE